MVLHQLQPMLAGDTTYPVSLHLLGPFCDTYDDVKTVQEPDGLQPAFAPILDAVDRAIAAVTQHGASGGDLRRLEDQLVLLLSMIERNPGIQAAADDIYRAACTVARSGWSPTGTIRDPRLARLLREASARLRDRLPSAKPFHSGETKLA